MKLDFWFNSSCTVFLLSLTIFGAHAELDGLTDFLKTLEPEEQKNVKKAFEILRQCSENFDEVFGHLPVRSNYPKVIASSLLQILLATNSKSEFPFNAVNKYIKFDHQKFLEDLEKYRDDFCIRPVKNN